MQIIDTFINKALSLDPDLLPKLAKFQDKSLCIHLTDLNFKFYVQTTEQGLMLSTAPQQATATISGSSFHILKMSLSSSENTLAALQKNHLTISGDMDFGIDMKRVLDEAHIDWEEQLSRLTGDVIAHQLSEHFTQSRAWLQSFQSRMHENIKDYLQEEARFFPTHAEFEDWVSDLDQLRMASERVQARFDRLKKSRHHD